MTALGALGALGAPGLLGLRGLDCGLLGRLDLAVVVEFCRVGPGGVEVDESLDRLSGAGMFGTEVF